MMKKLFAIFIVIILISSKINAQQASAIYLAIQPHDNGLGVRGDYYLCGFGLYNSLSYGNGGVYKTYDLKHHIKVSTGILIPLRDSYNSIFDITAGVNYHYLKSAILDNPVNPKIFDPMSFELGISVKYPRFAIGLRTDILRWESSVDIGIPLKY